MAKKNKKSSARFNPSKHLLDSNSPFTVKEAYKSLRTNVAFSIPGGDAKCIGITSAGRGDGKSVVAINLAISFAEIGKKVIIIDGDMRIPTVATKLGMKKSFGLSDYLVSEESINHCIFKLSKYNLAVLPSGNKPPEPTSLLESKQMEDLISVLRNYYDYIIIDLPPVSFVTDALIISKYVDGYLFVIHHNESKYKEVSQSIKQLQFAGAKVLGFVYNKKPFGGKKYRGSNYYKYSYYES